MILFAIAGAYACCAGLPRASALVVTTTTLDTTQPPSDDPGWIYVSGGGPNYTYLGNGWALTAWHVGVNLPLSAQGVKLGNTNYGIIPGQGYPVPNPTGQGLSQYTDLYLVRLKGDPGLAPITIASQALTVGNVNSGSPLADVTYAGQGPTRQESLSTWNTHQGYYGAGDYTKRWGRNRVINEAAIYQSETDDDVRAKVSPQFPDKHHGWVTVTADVISSFTMFDQTGGMEYEAQAIGGDSGSAVFRKNGSQWELAGIVNSVLIHEGQSLNFAAFGTVTTFADLTFYKEQIENVMNSHPNYSLVGDINLDGNVTGDGSGSWATDDVTAFIQGWNWQQPQPNVESWKKGDINQDGITNVADYFLMRNALAASGAGSGSSALAGLLTSGGGVPEPASLALVVASLLGTLGFRRCRYEKYPLCTVFRERSAGMPLAESNL